MTQTKSRPSLSRAANGVHPPPDPAALDRDNAINLIDAQAPAPMRLLTLDLGFLEYFRALDRFRALMGQGDYAGCWLWLGNIGPNGYGRFGVRRLNVPAHRAAYWFFNGEFDPELCVLHRCDTPRCVNPRHLFIGDRGDNARDMAAKGRQFLQRHPDRVLRGDAHPARHDPSYMARGEAHGMTSLTADQVRDLRRRRRAGATLGELAAHFKVCKSTASNIVTGKTWGHVSREVPS